MIAAGYRPVWDYESFYLVSALQYLFPDRTLFRGVRQLPPGHYLTFSEYRLQVQRYWDIDYPGMADAVETSSNLFADSVDKCRELLVDAITMRLSADVPICCHLSGGLDSSTVLGIASHIRKEPVDAFALSFEDHAYDETTYAADVAAHCGARLHRIRVGQDDLLQQLDSAVRGSEGLAINGHLPAKYLLHQAVRDAGFKVVLTGEGADEAFGGYAHQRIDFLKHAGELSGQEQLASANETSLGMMIPYGSALDLSSLTRRLGFTPSYLQAKAGLGWRVQSLMRPDFLAAYKDRDAYSELLDATELESRCSHCHPVDQTSWLWSKTALANYILRTLGDGTEMPASVEGRVPFLDHQLIEFLTTLPAAVRMQGPIEKALLREAARPFIPEAIYRRQKHPLDAPPLCLFATANGLASIRERLASLSFESQPFFCQNRCKQLLDRLSQLDINERRAWDPALMTALTTDAMQKWISEDMPEEQP